MFESITQWVGMALILVFTVWGIAGLLTSLGKTQRNTLRNWWRGSRYGSVGEPGAGPTLARAMHRPDQPGSDPR
jgi:hypothetical protein